MDTLLLNADGMPLSMLPVSFVDWQMAIKLVCLDKVKVIKNHDQWAVHSPSTTIEVPSIIMMKSYIKWPKYVRFSRQNIFLRDDFICQLQITSRCKRDNGKGHNHNELTMDHIKPRSFGGELSWSNIITACAACNSHKGNGVIKPMKLPNKPSYYELIEKRKKLPITVKDLAWVDYLGWDDDKIYYHPHGGKKTKYKL